MSARSGLFAIGFSFLVVNLGCSKSTPPPAETAAEKVESSAPAASAEGQQKMPKLDPPENGPKAIELGEGLPERLAPQGCLKPPPEPPFAALFHRTGPGGKDRFIFYRSGDGVAVVHRDDHIHVFVRGDEDKVKAFQADPKTLDTKSVEVAADQDEWSEVSSPFPIDKLENEKAGILALRPRRCTQVQMKEGEVDGAEARILHLPGLDLPESVRVKSKDGEDKWTLMGFVGADSYAALVAKVRPSKKAP